MRLSSLSSVLDKYDIFLLHYICHGTTEGGWIMIFEPEKIASHGNLGCSIPQISAYIANLRTLGTLVASELPRMTFQARLQCF